MVRALPADQIPKHVGVMLDGNRRWAKAVGHDTAHGHRAGAANIEPLLDWCEEVGVEVVTLWLLSTDNLNRRAEELEPLLEIIEEAVATLAEQRRWRLHPVGALDLLPAAHHRAAQAGRRRHPRRRRAAGQHRGRVRRPARDRRRRPLAARRARRQGHQPRGARPGHRRRAHRRPPLHQGPARPRPGDPDLRRAAARRLPALAERPLGVLLLRGVLARLPPGRLPARDPGVRPARAPVRLLTGPRRSGPFTCSSPRVRACRAGRPRGTGVLSEVSASGEARRAGRTVRERSRPTDVAGIPLRPRGPALRSTAPCPVHRVGTGTGRGVRAPVREG